MLTLTGSLATHMLGFLHGRMLKKYLCGWKGLLSMPAFVRPYPIIILIST